MQWDPLNSDSHSNHLRRRSISMRPYGDLLLRLAEHPDAELLFGHWSHDLFYIGTASSYDESIKSGNGTIVIIEQLRGDLFRIRSRGEGPAPSFGWHQEGSELKWHGRTQDVRGESAVTAVYEILSEHRST